MKTLAARCALLFGLTVTLMACPQFPDEDADTTTTNRNNSDGSNADPGPAEERTCAKMITYDEAPNASSVAIAGEFNDWDETALPMEREDGQWRVELMLAPGHYAYKFVVDGEYESTVPPDVATKWAGEFENRNLIIQDCSVPAFRVVDNTVTSDGVVTATLKFISATGGAKIDPASVELTLNREPIEPKDIDVDNGVITVEQQVSEYGKYSLRASAADTEGRPVQDAPLWVPMWHEEEEFVWQDSTMYLIFTDRFRDSDGGMPVPPIEGVNPIAGYMGGDFKGIIDKLEEGYFEELGVNLLWLSPIYENTDQAWLGGDGVNRYTGYHGYWPVDPLKAESRYGDDAQSADARLRELIDKAHERGIRVLFDVVHNHVHEDHSYCEENASWCAITCTCGEPGCAWEGPGGKPLTCQFAPYLPDLSYRNHAILQRQVDDTMRLGEMFDIDGFRVDAAKHMDHIIMRTLRRRVDALEDQGAAPFYMVGETYVGGNGYGLIMNYVADYELHGQFDFPLLYPIRSVFGHDGTFRELEDAVVRSEQAYGDAYTWMSPFLGNHDIPRFVTDSLGNDFDVWNSEVDVMADGPANEINDQQWNIINRMSMGFAFLLTQPGIPLMYYGDEIGLAGAGDPDNRRMMDWEWNAGQQELIERVRTIGQARQDLEPLRRGGRTELWVDETLYVYARHTGPGEAVVVAMNKGENSRSEQVTIPPSLGLGGKVLTSVTSDRTMTVNGSAAAVDLDSWEYAIFRVQ